MTLEELKAENARLKAELAYDKRVQLHVDKLAAEFTQSEVERLKAEVERLRKAGDAMAEAMWYGDAERSIWVKKFAETEWNAAKEASQA